VEKRLSNMPIKTILAALLVIAVIWSAAGVLVVGNLRSASAESPPPEILTDFYSQPTYVLAQPDSTATPTPFQPLAPTAELALAGITVETSLPPTPVPATPVPPTPTLPAPTAALTAEPVIEGLPSQVNILLLGSDRRPWDAGFRTDTIILLTLNSELGRVNITSFPRDLWVTLPGWGPSRINTAWTYGGYKMLHETFKHNFGVEVDYHVLIDFSSFKKIVDSLGGLDVQVAEPVSDYRGGYWVTIPKGTVHMDADKVLWYVRTRKTTNDIARNRRQQEVLTAMFEKFVSINAIRRAPELFDLYNNSVKTDIELVDMLKWLPFAAKIIETRDIHPYYITYKQVYDWITPEGAMVLVPNKEALMQVIRKSQNKQ
jgi:LCP family protein required for cell wall assembly